MRFLRLPSLSIRLKQGLTTGLLCGLLLTLIRPTDRLQPLDRAAMDTMFQFRGKRSLSRDIVVVRAEEGDIEKLGGWPLPRSIYARLVERFHKAGTKTIAFDILFQQDAPKTERDEAAGKGPKALPLEDIALGDAIANAGNVVHAANFYLQAQIDPLALQPIRPETDYPSGQAPRDRLSRVPERFSLALPNDLSCLTATSGYTARPQLLAGAVGIGHVTVYPEWDGALRRVPNVIRFVQRVETGSREIGEQERLYPSLALATAAHFLDVPRSAIRVESHGQAGGEVVLPLPGGEKRRIPLNSDGETLINWVGQNVRFNPLTFREALDTNAHRDEEFKGKVILIGIAAAGAYEHHATPFSPNFPAVLVQANALDDILSNRLLREAPDWLQVALILMLSALAGLMASGRNAKSTAVLFGLLCFSVYTLSAMLLAFGNYYLPVGIALVGAAIACAAALGIQQIADSQQLRLAEERYALAVRGANDGLWDWNLISNAMYFSPRWKEMMGCEDNEISQNPDEWFRRVHPEEIGLLRDTLSAHISGKTPHFEQEYQMLHKNGTYRWMLSRGLVIRNEEGRAVRMAGSHTDVTGRKQAEKQLHRNAFYDTLTGLPNRALFINRLDQAVGRAQRKSDYKFAVLFLDVDRFKNINDSLGHASGDLMIKEMARRIAGCLRLGDTPARIGGDEFAVLLDDIADANDATRVAERFQQELSQVFMLGEHEFAPSISVGIALSTTGYEHAADVLRDAEIAVARAKSLGMGRREIFDTAMHERAVRLLRLESDLRRALEKQSFEVYYQAIVELKSGRIAGFEALARWLHPSRGMISPGDFIPVAEDTGLIVPLDQWMLRESCRQMMEWQERAGGNLPLFMSVNLSSKQFSSSDLVEQVQQALTATNFEPRRLKLEITESAIMDNAETAASMLLEMREMGIQLSIDDFGTGYSSLSYLHRFPLDTLKIDRSFVARMGDHGEEEIVRTIIMLSKNLAMAVVAEGVETQEQLDILRKLDCDYGQGYLFSRPLTAEDAFKLIQRNPTW